MLSPQQQELLKRAREAKPDYAVALLTDLVKQVPEHLEARQVLRANELIRFHSTSSLSKKLSGVKITPLQMRGKGALKKDPKEAMAIAEDILAIDPTSESGNELLADAARELGLDDVAVMALETLKDAKPEYIPNIKRLGALYLELGQPDKALAVYDLGIKHAPTDGELSKGMKDASALQAQSSGGWEEGSSYRESLANADQARQLEQATRAHKSTDTIQEQLELLYQQYNENNQNIDVVKKIADLLEKINDFENSLAYYRYAYELSGRTDPQIEKTIYSIQERSLNQGLEAKKAELEQASPENQPAIQAEIEQLEGQLAEYQLSGTRERVKRYPNDKALRFELGKLLYLSGHYQEAIPELQQATNAPNVRHQSLNYLGLCYQSRKIYDLAINQFEKAVSEMLSMDNDKKEVIYNLGITYELSGNNEKALEQFKTIYEVDYHYKDVAQRVEAAYGS
jgi:tetratricopeptide (TPR) repeat protein